nr:hypothetical protein CFP56_21234 [Quercus suber]
METCQTAARQHDELFHYITTSFAHPGCGIAGFHPAIWCSIAPCLSMAWISPQNASIDHQPHRLLRSEGRPSSYPDPPPDLPSTT